MTFVSFAAIIFKYHKEIFGFIILIDNKIKSGHDERQIKEVMNSIDLAFADKDKKSGSGKINDMWNKKD